jgi:ATP-binding cassette subfamily B (MDR/TAP) protein 9
MQDTGFFDGTKTGEITSRLSADCSTVSDQVSLNANVLARTCMQAATVLAFMLAANWRLTFVTFILIPVNIQVCSRKPSLIPVHF